MCLNQYAPLGDFLAATPYWRYDRIPVGSVHFIANAFWADALAASSDNAILLQLTREKIISLYLGGAASINTYDHLVNESTPASTENNIDKIYGGGCAPPLPANIPVGMWLSHEIILGGAAGRKAEFEEALARWLREGSPALSMDKFC